MDHVIPWAQGGADRLTNLVPACSATAVRHNRAQAFRDAHSARLRATLGQPSWESPQCVPGS
ncbi:HNH endonuclease [Streptomyces violaceus]|uniref:HNH endonuclease n=1 Tax=Streptomyces violaceus TaxID=1936 RepID=UPI0038B5F7AA